MCNHRQSRTVHQNSTIRPRTTSQSRTVHDLWIRANGCKLPTLAYRGMLKKKKITCTGLGPRFSAERSHTSWVSAILHTKSAQFGLGMAWTVMCRASPSPPSSLRSRPAATTEPTFNHAISVFCDQGRSPSSAQPDSTSRASTVASNSRGSTGRRLGARCRRLLRDQCQGFLRVRRRVCR